MAEKDEETVDTGEETEAQDEAVAEPEASEADAPEGDAPQAEAAKPARRRGSAETGSGTRAKQAAPKVDGEVVVRARARYVRSAPRKARLVMDHIRGRPVEQARAMLTHTPRAISTDILKLLDSAIANAESAYELGADELRIRRAYVDEGPTIKRYRPRAMGRATQIKKRTSHMTIELTSGERN
jgi:large subunit ribosomal protein L22